jgi:hypothetical protein
MAGEQITSAQLTSTGLVGDRVVQVYDRRGRIVTARTFPRLLQLHATLGLDGEPLVEGLPWHARETLFSKYILKTINYLSSILFPSDSFPSIIVIYLQIYLAQHGISITCPLVISLSLALPDTRQWRVRRPHCRRSALAPAPSPSATAGTPPRHVDPTFHLLLAPLLLEKNSKSQCTYGHHSYFSRTNNNKYPQRIYSSAAS